MSLSNAVRRASIIKVISPKVIVNTEQSAAVSMAGLAGSLFCILDVSASGGGVTYEIKLQTNATGTGNFTDVPGGEFTKTTAESASSQVLKLDSGVFKGYARADITVTGTGDAGVSCNIIAFPKYA